MVRKAKPIKPSHYVVIDVVSLDAVDKKRFRRRIFSNLFDFKRTMAYASAELSYFRNKYPDSYVYISKLYVNSK